MWMFDRAGGGGSVAATYCYTPWAYSGNGPWAVGGNFSQALDLGVPVAAFVADPERAGSVIITADGALLTLDGVDGNFRIRTQRQLVVGSDAYRAALSGMLFLRWTDGLLLGALTTTLNGSAGTLFVDLNGTRAPLFLAGVTAVPLPSGSGGQGGLIGRDAPGNVLWIAALEEECRPLVLLVISVDGPTGAPLLRLVETIPLGGLVADGTERVCVETGQAVKPIAAVVHPSGAWLALALESYGIPGGQLVRIDLNHSQAAPDKRNLPQAHRRAQSAAKSTRRPKQVAAPSFSAAAAAAVEQVHLSTTENAGELAVVWLSGVGVGCDQTAARGEGRSLPAQLRYRLVGKGGGWLDLVNATSTCVDTVSASGWRGAVHRAQIPPLRHLDDGVASIEYQVSAPAPTSDAIAANFSGSFVCRQAPTDDVGTFDVDGEGGFALAVVGDMGAVNSEETVSAIAAAVKRGAVNAVFHNGDIAYALCARCGGRPAQVRAYLAFAQVR
jgi:hypothetical protein